MRKLLEKAVDLAFQTAGDLVTASAFNDSSNAVFDFLTKQVTKEDISITIPVIVLKGKRKENSLEKQVILKTKDAPGIDHYDFLELSGIKYRIGKPLEQNDYITKLTVFYDKPVSGT
jgi:hypothetical protein